MNKLPFHYDESLQASDHPSKSTLGKDLRHFAKVWCFGFLTATAGLLVVYIA